MKTILSEKDIRKKSWMIEVRPRDRGKAKKLIDQVSTSGHGAGNMFTFYDSADAKQVRNVLINNNVGILSADFV
jgi:hypothetical protein